MWQVWQGRAVHIRMRVMGEMLQYTRKRLIAFAPGACSIFHSPSKRRAKEGVYRLEVEVNYVQIQNEVVCVCNILLLHTNKGRGFSPGPNHFLYSESPLSIFATLWQMLRMVV